jgi:hypothetical protein
VTSFRSIGCVLVLVALIAGAGTARADTDGPPTIVVLVDPGDSGIDPALVRREIARELRASITNTPAADARGTLTISVRGPALTAIYVSAGGRELTRVVSLPSDAKQRLEVITLLAGNLARDEASGLIEGLSAPPAPSSSDSVAGSGQAPGAPPVASEQAAVSRSAPAVDTGVRGAAPAVQSKRARAVRAEDRSTAVNLSLFHPVAIYPDSHRRSVHLELGLAYSRLGALAGMALNPGVIRTEHAARGVSAAGLWTRAKGRSDGAFASGLFSLSEGPLRGAEVSGLFSSRLGSLQGAQVSGIWQQAHELAGAQMAGIFSRSGDVDGLQASGVVSYAENVEGVQASGIFSRARDHAGLQVSGVVNRGAELHGIQAAGAVNVAEGVTGAQIALVNVNGDVRGAQIGLVNVARRVSGAQIGLVNSAEQVDGLSLAPVGLLRNNRIQPLLWLDTAVAMNLGVKYSSGRLYSLFAAGFDPTPKTDEKFAMGGAIGAHVARFGSWSGAVDVLYRYVSVDLEQESEHSTVLRAVIDWSALPQLGVFAAGGVEHRVDVDNTHRARPYVAGGLSLF